MRSPAPASSVARAGVVVLVFGMICVIIPSRAVSSAATATEGTQSMTLTNVDIEGSHITTAQIRLAWAADTIGNRLDELVEGMNDGELGRWVGPPAEVHIYGDVGTLLTDDTCLAHLAYIAHHGERAGVVVHWHGALDTISTALAAQSGALAAALASGRTFRYSPPPARSAGVGLAAAPATEADAAAYSEGTAIDVWVALLLGDAAALIRIFDKIGYAAATVARGPGWLDGRRLLSDALRRAADAVLIGSGGTVLGKRMVCPLCPEEPLLLPEQLPGHLIEKHRLP